MAKNKTPAPADTSAGTSAYILGTAHKADVEPRLPAGTLANLAADLTLLGADPNPQPPPGAGPPQPAPPTLAEAMADTVAIITGIHEAIQGAKATTAVRKAYGAASRAATKEIKAVTEQGQKILARAQAYPTEALSLGILPADTVALAKALADATAAEAALKSQGGTTAKERHAAEVRMHEAVARIAGAGALAFARNAAVRAEFEALKPKKG